jgi:uncharacterized membrane protein YkvA (DUF1232 family)
MQRWWVVRVDTNDEDERVIITKKPLPKIACILIAVACLAYEFSPFTWLDNVVLPLPFGFVDDGIAVVALIWSIREYRRHGTKETALTAVPVPELPAESARDTSKQIQE